MVNPRSAKKRKHREFIVTEEQLTRTVKLPKNLLDGNQPDGHAAPAGLNCNAAGSKQRSAGIKQRDTWEHWQHPTSRSKDAGNEYQESKRAANKQKKAKALWGGQGVPSADSQQQQAGAPAGSAQARPELRRRQEGELSTERACRAGQDADQPPRQVQLQRQEPQPQPGAQPQPPALPGRKRQKLGRPEQQGPEQGQAGAGGQRQTDSTLAGREQSKQGNAQKAGGGAEQHRQGKKAKAKQGVEQLPKQQERPRATGGKVAGGQGSGALLEVLTQQLPGKQRQPKQQRALQEPQQQPKQQQPEPLQHQQPKPPKQGKPQALRESKQQSDKNQRGNKQRQQQQQQEGDKRGQQQEGGGAAAAGQHQQLVRPAAVPGAGPGTAGAGQKPADGTSSKLLDKMRAKLQGGHFRQLNELLYTRPGDEALRLMSSQPGMFAAYHAGFEAQTRGWPLRPVDVAARWLAGLAPDAVVADFGCGDARLAASVRQTVHSLDLVAAVPGVIACNMAHTPLAAASCDAAVFSLALMGTDYGAFLEEARRVLKPQGWLWIAEVRSRFSAPHSDKEDIRPFIHCLKQLGFQLLQQDASNRMFVTLLLRKTRELPRPPAGVRWPQLKACVYKRR